MRLKIYSCHDRKPELTCNTEIFQTLVCNLPAPDDGCFMSDLGGINMAENHLYAELRHQYFVWQNLIDRYDYVGFEHYQRPFFIDTLPASQLTRALGDIWEMRLWFAAFNKAAYRCEADSFRQYLAMRRSLDKDDITHLKQWIGGYDVILPRPNVVDIEHKWKAWDPVWETVVEGVNRSEIFRARPNQLCFEVPAYYFANMYIMRSDLLNEYLTFCFGILEFCQSRMHLPDGAPGHVAERLFSFWLYQKRIETPTLRVLELPCLCVEQPPARLNDNYSFSPRKPV